MVTYLLCLFTVNSFYKALKMQHVGFHHKFLWKIKLLQIKVFLWLILKSSILTKDNLIRRGWKGDKCCQFSGADETIDHLFIKCPVHQQYCDELGRVASRSFGAD